MGETGWLATLVKDAGNMKEAFEEFSDDSLELTMQEMILGREEKEREDGGALAEPIWSSVF